MEPTLDEKNYMRGCAVLTFSGNRLEFDTNFGTPDGLGLGFSACASPRCAREQPVCLRHQVQAEGVRITLVRLLLPFWN
jgi:hypothetical protein